MAISRGFMRSREDGSVGGAHDDNDGRRGYGGAQLLILDEPTASLDTQSEYDV